MNASWHGFLNRRGASTVEYIVVLAALAILAMAVYHTLSGEETAHTISEKIQAVITGEPTSGGERQKQEEQTQTSPEAVDSEEQTLPQRNENPDPPLPEEEEKSLGMQIAKGAGEAALDFVGFYDAKAALTGVDEEGNSIGVGERFLRGAMVIPIAKPVKGAKMAVKYGDKALTAGKKKLDDVAQRGKKAACGCPPGEADFIHRSVKNSLEKVEKIRQTHNVGVKRNIAFAEFDINGRTGELIGISGKAERPGTVGVPKQRRFETITTGNNPRTLDAEVKILEEMATRIPKNSKGTIHLFSELPICVSCSGVIQQFEKQFPNIELIVTHGPGR
jgi:hypothetical protein